MKNLCVGRLNTCCRKREKTRLRDERRTETREESNNTQKKFLSAAALTRIIPGPISAWDFPTNSWNA